MVKSCLSYIAFIISSSSFALPFNVTIKENTILPTAVYPDNPVRAYYKVENNTNIVRKNNYVKYLPPNVTQITKDPTFPDTCGTRFSLAPKGQSGSSCTLQLSVSGAVFANDQIQAHHLFVCFPEGKTCASTQNSLNVTQEQYGKYGVFESSSSAGSDLTKSDLQSNFTDTIVCPGDLATNYSTLCDDNAYYLNNDPTFGLSTIGTTTDNYVSSKSVAEVQRVAIKYTSPGLHVAGSQIPTVEASGLILIPKIAADEIKGILLYYHPTILSKCGVPSGINNGESSNCKANTKDTQNILAATWATSGYIVIAPDYLGQGENSESVHSHNLFPQYQSINGIYMLPAAATYLQQKGIDVSKIKNLVISAYSEGSVYALWASRLLQSSLSSVIENLGLELKHTFGMSGLYNQSGVDTPFYFSNVDNTATSSGPTEDNIYHLSPGCIADGSPSSATVCGDSGYLTPSAALSLARVAIAQGKIYSAVDLNTYITYSATTAPYEAYMPSDFADQTTCIDPADITRVYSPNTYSYKSCQDVLDSYGGSGGPYTFQELFLNNGLNNKQIRVQIEGASVGSSTQNLFTIGNLSNYTSLQQASDNGKRYNLIASFIYPTLITDPQFNQELRDTNIYNWETTSPISLIYLRYDSIATNRNSASACDANQPSLLSNSTSGLVECIQDKGIPSQSSSYPQTDGINNTNLWSIYQDNPLYLSHGDAEGMFQLVALAVLSN